MEMYGNELNNMVIFKVLHASVALVNDTSKIPCPFWTGHYVWENNHSVCVLLWYYICHTTDLSFASNDNIYSFSLLLDGMTKMKKGYSG